MISTTLRRSAIHAADHLPDSELGPCLAAGDHPADRARGSDFWPQKHSFFASVTKTNFLLRGLFQSCGGVSGKMAKIAGEQAKGLAALKQIGLSGV